MTAPTAGVMGQYLAQVGDNVAVGAVIATIEAGSGAAAAPAAAAPAAALAPAAPAAAASDAAVLSPAVRRAVLEHGIDPATVTGTGKDGRLTKEDVVAAAQAKTSAPAAAAPAVEQKVAESETRPVNGILGRGTGARKYFPGLSMPW